MINTKHPLPLAADHVAKKPVGQSMAEPHPPENASRSDDSAQEDDLESLYEGMMTSEGEDVYLSDGLWLSADGSLHER